MKQQYCYTLRGAARLLSMHAMTVLRLIQEGHLNAIDTRSKGAKRAAWKIRHADIEKLWAEGAVSK